MKSVVDWCNNCGHQRELVNGKLCNLCWHEKQGNLAEVLSSFGDNVIHIKVPRKELRKVKKRLLKAGFVIKEPGVDY